MCFGNASPISQLFEECQSLLDQCSRGFVIMLRQEHNLSQKAEVIRTTSLIFQSSMVSQILFDQAPRGRIMALEKGYGCCNVECIADGIFVSPLPGFCQTL